jgi:hypothetical protein
MKDSSPPISGVEALHLALATLAKENEQRRQTRRVLVWTIGIGVAVLLVLKLISWYRSGTLKDIWDLAPLLALMGAGAAFTSQHRNALETVARLATRETAGYIIEAYATTEERDIRKLCESALPQALSQVESPDDIDDYQRNLLYKLLRGKAPLPVHAAAVECVGRIAGAEALPAIESFVATNKNHAEVERSRLADRAFQILPDVRIRAARRIITERSTASDSAATVEADRLRVDA